LKKNFFFIKKIWWGHKKIKGYCPLTPPRTTELPEIKAITKGALAGMFPRVTGLLGRYT